MSCRTPLSMVATNPESGWATALGSPTLPIPPKDGNGGGLGGHETVGGFLHPQHPATRARFRESSSLDRPLPLPLPGTEEEGPKLDGCCTRCRACQGRGWDSYEIPFFPAHGKSGGHRLRSSAGVPRSWERLLGKAQRGRIESPSHGPAESRVQIDMDIRARTSGTSQRLLDRFLAGPTGVDTLTVGGRLRQNQPGPYSGGTLSPSDTSGATSAGPGRPRLR